MFRQTSLLVGKCPMSEHYFKHWHRHTHMHAHTHACTHTRAHVRTHKQHTACTHMPTHTHNTHIHACQYHRKISSDIQLITHLIFSSLMPDNRALPSINALSNRCRSPDCIAELTSSIAAWSGFVNYNRIVTQYNWYLTFCSCNLLLYHGIDHIHCLLYLCPRQNYIIHVCF